MANEKQGNEQRGKQQQGNEQDHVSKGWQPQRDRGDVQGGYQPERGERQEPDPPPKKP